jgi:predicted small metal-binding protein
MKKILCQEIGGSECNWEFLGATEEEVIRKARDHGKKMHAAEMDEATLRSHIRDA